VTTDDFATALHACAAGIPVDLRNTVTSLDDRNTARLLAAIRHATGDDEVPHPAVMVGRVPEFQMKSGFPPQDSIAVLSLKSQSSSARPAPISKSRQSLAASLTMASS